MQILTWSRLVQIHFESSFSEEAGIEGSNLKAKHTTMQLENRPTSGIEPIYAPQGFYFTLKNTWYNLIPCILIATEFNIRGTSTN